MKRILVGVVLLVGTALAEPPVTEGPAPASATGEGMAASASETGTSAAAQGAVDASPVPEQGETPKVAVPSGAPVPLTAWEPRLSDIQAVRARGLPRPQVGTGVGASDGAPVVAPDGLGLELERRYASHGGGR